MSKQKESSANASSSGGKGGQAHGERREALLRAAIRLIARDGIDALTFRSLASEAGVAYGLALYHFESREAMLDEALALCVREHRDRFDRGLAARNLDELGIGIPDLISEEHEKAAFQLLMLLESRRELARAERVKETYDTYIRGVADVLEEVGVEATPAVATLVYAAIDGLVLQQLVYQQPERTAASLAVLREMLHFLRSDETSGQAH